MTDQELHRSAFGMLLATAVTSLGLWGMALLWSVELAGSITVLLAVLGAVLVTLAKGALDHFANSVSPAIGEMTGYLATPLAMMAAVNFLGFTALVAPDIADLFPIAAVFLVSGLVGRLLVRQTCSPSAASGSLRDESTQPVPPAASFDPESAAPASTIPMPGFLDDRANASQIEDEYAEEGESADVLLSQRLGHNESGEMFVSGWLRVELSRASSSVQEIVTFPKPLSGVPEIELEPEDPDVQVRLLNCTEVGMRLRLELDPSATGPIATTVAFYAAEVSPVGETGAADLSRDSGRQKVPLP